MISELLDSEERFVITFKTIIDYINWLNPSVERDERKIKTGLKRWNRAVETLLNDGIAVKNIPDKIYMIGAVYHKDLVEYVLYSDEKPRIPHKPSNLWLYHKGVIYLLKLRREVYIWMLKKIARNPVIKY